MTSLTAALDAAETLQTTKLQRSTPTQQPVAGLGPDRPMPYISALRAGDLFVDHAYQRDLDRPRVRRMVEAWDPTMLGVLDVSDRGPDASPRYAIINGQHRHATALAADPRGPEVPLVCNVHRGLSPADEAALFHELDATAVRLSSWDRWRARRAAGDPAVRAIEEIAAGFGLSCSAGQNDGRVGAVGALETLHQLGGPELVAGAVNALFIAYGRAWAAYQAPLITGVGLLLRHYEGLTSERLAEALAKSTPQLLRSQAVAYRELMPGQLARLVAQVLVNRMNTGRGAKLPDVRDQVPAGRLRPAREAASS